MVKIIKPLTAGFKIKTENQSWFPLHQCKVWQFLPVHRFLHNPPQTDHQWPTAKPVMLDFAGSIIFPTASPDSHLPSSMKITGHQFWCSLANTNGAARYWAVCTGPSEECCVLVPPSWSLSDSLTPEACYRSLCRAQAVILLFILTQSSRYCWVIELIRPCPALFV